MITFTQIEPGIYDSLRELDRVCFNRGEHSRSNENLANHCLIDPRGCIALRLDERLIGYVFSRSFGDIGYIGPLGVDPAEQDRGYGKLVVNAGVDYLKGHCRVIGLETKPEWGKNIALYHKLGFRTTLPSRMMQKTIAVDKVGELPEHLICGNQLNPSEAEQFGKVIDSWADEIFPGLRFSKEIQAFYQKYPEKLLLAMVDHRVAGVMGFHPEFHHFIWGGVKPGLGDEKVLKELLLGMEILNPGGKLVVRFHTHYHRLTNVLLDLEYKLTQDMTCMLLEGFEGEYRQERETLLLRCWVD